MKYKILVTGGLGFIGSEFINYINQEKNISILNIDKLTYASDKNRIKLKHKNNYKFKKIDINNFSLLKKAIISFNPKYIVNFAAETHVDNSIKRADSFMNTNFLGVYNILEAIKENSDISLIQISTDEVYGDVLKGKSKEIDILNPSSPYSASKAAAEQIINAYKRTFKVKTLILRPCNAFGPGQNQEKLIPNCCYKLTQNKPINIYGNGKNIREWIYVNDLAKCIKLSIEKFDILCGGKLNVSSNYFLNNLSLAKNICTILKRKPYKKYLKFTEDRKGHDFRYANNNSKLLKNLEINKGFFKDTESKLRDTILKLGNKI